MNGGLTVERMEANQKVKSRIFVIDNYDSFTFNLVQYFGELGCDLVVHRNDQITVDEIEHLQVDRIVISPGPGRPSQAGISIETIRTYAGRKPILGVCLGHQAIGEAFGATVVRAEQLMHGKTSGIFHAGDSVFSGLPSPFEATRYHSLVVSRSGLPESLRVTAWTEDGVIMGLEHSEYPVYGVQFHPESILTRVGKDILRNFLCSENLRKS